MSKDFNQDAFKELLRKAIGPFRSQAEFARQSGISTGHLNRMLNTDVAKPETTTLHKIAACAEKRVSMEELMDACGYETDRLFQKKQKSERSLMEIGKRAQACADDIMKGFTELLSERPYTGKDLYSLVSTFDMLYAEENLCYEIMEERPRNFGSGANGRELRGFADHSSVVEISWSDCNYNFRMDIALCYTKTTAGCFVVYWAEYGMEDLLEAGSPLAKEIQITTTGTEERLPAFCWEVTHIHPENEFAARVKNPQLEGLSQEERILKVIFDPLATMDRHRTVEGRGFYIEGIPHEFKKFFEKHKDTFSQSEKESDLYESFAAIKEDDAWEVNVRKLFDGYEGEVNEDSGWGAVVTTVIYRETGIRFSFWDSESYPKVCGNKHSCILFEETMPYFLNEQEKALTEASLKYLIDEFAGELGTKEATECYFVLEVDPNDVKVPGSK